MNFGILLVQGLVNSFGTIVMAAFAAAVKIDTLAYSPVQDFGNAVSTFVAQNYGAGKHRRIKDGRKQSMIAASVFCVCVSAVVFIFAERFMGLFVSDGTEIINVGAGYLRIEGSFYIGIGILFLLYGFYRAVGKPEMSLILTIISLGTRVVLAYALSAIPKIGVIGIWISVPIGWFLADMTGLLYMKKFNKVVLAYSGGLDTSIIISWLKETYGCEVIAVVGNVGQADELEGLEEKALKTGASKIYIEDLTKEFVYDYIFPTLQAGAVYEGKYLLGTSFARPLIGKRLVEIAEKEGADAICHGCTGKGNDQVRFELAVKNFAPEMPIIAPWRIWDIKSREEEIQYALDREIPIKITYETNYSKDKNLWHLSHEGLDLEFPENEPKYDKILEMCNTIESAPDKATYITLTFEKGIPVALNGIKMDGVSLIEELNKIGGENAIGIMDMVENRLVGMKSRGVYETPGGTILYKAHADLEELCLDKATHHFKQSIALKFADLVYNGEWFTPLRESLSAFVSKTQETVTGDVKLKLYKGNIVNAGMNSPYSLYSEEYATFGEDGVYNQKDSEGFINLYGLPTVVNSKMKDSLKKKDK